MIASDDEVQAAADHLLELVGMHVNVGQIVLNFNEGRLASVKKTEDTRPARSGTEPGSLVWGLKPVANTARKGVG